MSDFAERAVSVIELQRVACVLRYISQVQRALKSVIARGGHGQFLSIVVRRKHFHHDNIRQPVVIVIGHVGTHGRVTLVLEVLSGPIGEGAVAVVDVEQIVRLEIVRHIDVRPAVLIDIVDSYPQAKAFNLDAGVRGDISKCIVTVVSVQSVGVGGPAVGAPRKRATSVIINHSILQQVPVQIPIPIIIKKDGLHRIAGVVESICSGSFGEGAFTFIYIQQVGHIGGRRAPGATYAHVDIF